MTLVWDENRHKTDAHRNDIKAAPWFQICQIRSTNQKFPKFKSELLTSLEMEAPVIRKNFPHRTTPVRKTYDSDESKQLRSMKLEALKTFQVNKGIKLLDLSKTARNT